MDDSSCAYPRTWGFSYGWWDLQESNPLGESIPGMSPQVLERGLTANSNKATTEATLKPGARSAMLIGKAVQPQDLTLHSPGQARGFKEMYSKY